jgi:CTP synthase (UTP-ammonia lyase)
VAGLPEAGHTEMNPDAPVPLLVLASCPIDAPSTPTRLSGKLKIEVSRHSLAFRSYRRTRIEEVFNCNYELNPVYRDRLEAGGLKVSGTSENGGARIIELPGRRFFLATGYLPQVTSTAGHPHPLIIAFLEAAAG